MSDTQAAAFGFAELCRIWSGSGPGRLGTPLAAFAAEEPTSNVPLPTTSNVPQPTNSEHPFDA